MSENFWDDEDDFRDNPVELEGGKWKEVESAVPVQSAPRQGKKPPMNPQRAAMPFVEDAVETVLTDEDEDDYTIVLNDARLRLEQGKLYELIMNSNLFDNMDSDARAIRNVQREIKRFARERMEVMLGMRQEAVKDTVVSPPFNSLEVDILKKLASAASKGATEQPEAAQATWDNPPPKRQSLTPISNGKAAPQAKKLALGPKTPVAKQTAPTPTKEEYEPLKKDPSQMTADELIERNKEAGARQAKNKPAQSSSAKPMPTFEQQEQLHAERMANTNVPIGRTPTPVSAILAAINNSKK